MTVRVRHLPPEQSPPSTVGTVILAEAEGVRTVAVVTLEGPCAALVSDLTLGGDFDRALTFARDLAAATGAGVVYVTRTRAEERASAGPRVVAEARP